MGEYGEDPRPEDERVNVKVNPWPAVVILLLLVVALVAGGVVTARSDAATVTSGNARSTDGPAEPYGGCDEGWQAPESEGARDCEALGWVYLANRGVLCPEAWEDEAGVKACRDAGWVIRWHFVIDPTGYAWTDLNICRWEDSRDCAYNAVRQGNRVGHGFITVGKYRWFVDYINDQRASSQRYGFWAKRVRS